MSVLPTGTVTFLFTDIEGSTRLLDELGAGYADVLADHHRIVRAAIEEHGGVEVDTQGDAFFVAFSRASDAVAAALRRRRHSRAQGCVCAWGSIPASRLWRTPATSGWTSIEQRG